MGYRKTKDVLAMANLLLNTRPDASAAEVMRKAAGMLRDLAEERAHLTQPAQAVDVELVDRLRKRAAQERQIAANNARVAELLAPELALFDAREGHNIYATRMAIDHRDSAKRDAAFADDLEAAATAITRAIGNAQAEGWPACSGNPSSCPENEGFGCCKANPTRPQPEE